MCASLAPARMLLFSIRQAHEVLSSAVFVLPLPLARVIRQFNSESACEVSRGIEIAFFGMRTMTKYRERWRSRSLCHNRCSQAPTRRSNEAARVDERAGSGCLNRISASISGVPPTADRLHGEFRRVVVDADPPSSPCNGAFLCGLWQDSQLDRRAAPGHAA